MKKLSVLILAAAALFAGCNNLTVEKNKDSKNGNVTINIANQSRTISPMSGYSLSDFEKWTITFKDQNGFIDDFSMTGTSGSFTFTVPAGLYTVTAESLYTPKTADGNDGTKLTLTGTRTDVEIGYYAEVNISVGLKKEATGNFSYTLPWFDGYVSLVNMNTKGTSYSAKIQSEETSEETSDVFKAVVDSGNEQVLVTGTGLKSGFYKLYVTDTPVVGVDNTGAVIYYDTDAVIYYDIGDFLVEIADGLTTTGSASSVRDSQTQLVYYGTNDPETGYNGKFPFARKNVNEILQLLIDNKKWQYAEIYMDTDVPKLDVVVINQLRDAMAAGNRSESGDGYYGVFIKGVSGDTLIDLYATEDKKSGEWKSEFSVDQVTELSLNADSADKYPEVSKKLVIDNDESDQNRINTLNLTDGVTVATSNLEVISEKLTVKLDNYNTYEKTEFLVFTDVPGQSVINIDFADEGYVAVQKTVSDDEEGPYTISWYVRRAYASGVDVDTATLDFYIKTEAKTGTNAGNVTIPVAADTKIVFETSIVDPDKSYTYAWYFTNRPYIVLDIDSEYEFDPTTAEEFDFTDGEPITIACVVSDDDGNWGSAVFEFVLTAAQSPIILYNNETLDNDSHSQFIQGLAAFDKIEEGQTIEDALLTTTATDFCFDSDCNLYVVTKVDSSYKIYKYTYSLFSGYSSENQTVATAAVDDAGGWQVISCDTTNGYIFYASDETINVYVPTYKKTYKLGVSVDKIIAAAPNFFSKTDTVTYSYSTEIKNIAVSNYVLYIAMDVIQTVGEETVGKTAIIARYTYSAPEESDESIETIWSTYVEPKESEIFENTTSVAVTVNDMMVQDSKLYVLVSQKEGSFDSLTHRGALLTITDDNVSLNLTSIDGANTAAYATGALDADTFYAPQKFLAVMPKKLVIADEGYWISNPNSPKDNSGFVNRVVTVDLDDYSSTEVDVGVSFDLDISITACGSLSVNDD